MNKYKGKILFTSAVILFITSIILSICIGSVSISFEELLQVLSQGIRVVETPAARIFWYARLPRTIASH